MVQDDATSDGMSPEQRTELLQLMYQVLQDVLARELAIYPKLRHCENKLEDFGNELEESASLAQEQMTEVEQRLRGQIGKMRKSLEEQEDQSTLEHIRLKVPLENMSKELEATKATLSRCVEELAKREEETAAFKHMEDEIAALKSMSARPAKVPELVKAEPAEASQKKGRNHGDGGLSQCMTRGKARHFFN